jgi:hypothetical protein
MEARTALTTPRGGYISAPQSASPFSGIAGTEDLMADQPTDDHSPRDTRSPFQPLSIEARRRLWEQIWNRLLAPPIDPATSPESSRTTAEEVADDAA